MDKSDPGLRVNWRQAGGEAVLIFLGVALALAGQAWWEWRSDRALESEYIVSLMNELEVNEVALVSLLAEREAARAAAAHLLHVLGDADVPGRSDTILIGAGNLGWSFGYNPRKAALDDLIGSGSLGLIRDPELRLALASYREEIELNQSLENQTELFFEQVLRPFYLDNIPTLEVGPRDREPDSLRPSRFEWDSRALENSLEFENVIAMYIYHQRDAILANGQLLDEVRSLMGHLR